jgi:hypothetical protein
MKGVSAMLRIVTRLTLLLAALAAVTVLMLGGLSLLASTAPADAASFLQRDQVASVERTIEAPAEESSGPGATPVVVLIFAGIVLMAALPPIHRIHVYHQSYHRSDWIH